MLDTIRDLCDVGKIELGELLAPFEFSVDDLDRLVESGYMPRGMYDLSGRIDRVILDTFYGTKGYASMFTPERFRQCLEEPSGADRIRGYPRKIPIKSAADAFNALNNVSQRWQDRISFRGQTSRYFTKRLFPNPISSDLDGYEEIVIPSFYRPFKEDWLARPLGKNMNMFQGLWADYLIYEGIDLSRLGDFYSMDEMEDSDNPSDREYYRRYVLHKLNAPYSGEYGILEQHYGIPTTGLDLTFDLPTALFFATHYFRSSGDRASFQPIEKGQHQGVVYCFVFHDPPCRASADLISELKVFDHIPPTRPITQRCALRNFDGSQLNQAMRDIEVVLELGESFSLDGLPSQNDLFPSPDADLFYKSLLKAKEKWPDLYNEVPYYE